LDLLGLGFGPANMALAVAVREANESRPAGPLRAAFFEAADRPRWHEGMLFPDASMQVAFGKDLATMRNPRSAYTFLQFLHERDRLSDFVNRGSMTPLRVEFVAYLRWAAERLADCVTYSSRVEAVAPVLRDGRIEAYDVDVSDPSGMTRVRTRHVAVAAGLQPRLPAELAGLREDRRVWHSAEHLPRIAGIDPGRVREVVVIGGGQSAAEVLLHLHDRLPHARLHAVHGRFGLTPSDSSPYANRIFDAATVDLLYDAADADRTAVDLLHSNTNDSVVAPATLQQLYDLDYRERWQGPGRFVWHRSARVVAATGRPDAVAVEILDRLTRRTTTVPADLVVAATGYTPLDVAGLLGEHADLLARDELGRPLAHRDYSARWSVEAPGRMFLIGQTRHQHGVSATLLSNIAVRAGEIVAALDDDPPARPATSDRAAAPDRSLLAAAGAEQAS
ncbi:MAG TPA: SidA/IucD/PvdA family monooxygenase, partial [Candidatus Nanopelagicales bacterium]|nr:SidA/IucD/PvdA family monooxygenase [Candidatus Nanopelagicales bacterium]